MGVNELKSVERSILRELELNSRTSFSSFGKKIRKSQQQISYTVNSLKDAGVIQNFYTTIDYSRLNVLQFRVYFKVNYIGENELKELIDYLVEDPYTAWICSCGGRYDLICTFFALNPSKFNKTLRNVMQKFPNQIKNYTILTTIVMRKFGRKYLFKNPSILPARVIGGDREPGEVDEIDMLILDKLSVDARKSCVDLSNELKITPKTVINRIKKLQKNKIIRGFSPLLDLRKKGMISTFLVIRYHNISSEVEEGLINYLKVHKNVINVVKTLGEWDVEIEIETNDWKELRRIEMEIRQKFALLIQQIESIPFYKSYKKNFFPKFLVEK
jgi:DNA-binding Lrp family transcriptional regulator